MPASKATPGKYAPEMGLIEAPLAPKQNRPAKAPLRLESIDAHEVVRSAIELCRREIASAQVEVLLDLDAEKNFVFADWARLLQVICTVVRNAVEFSPPCGIISMISANDALGRFTFELADHGIGAKALFFPRVFDSVKPSRRLYAGFQRDLEIAGRITEALGGTLLTIQGNEPDKGTTFLLTLNTAPPPGKAQAILLPERTEATADDVGQMTAPASEPANQHGADLKNRP